MNALTSRVPDELSGKVVGISMHLECLHHLLNLGMDVVHALPIRASIRARLSFRANLREVESSRFTRDIASRISLWNWPWYRFLRREFCFILPQSCPHGRQGEGSAGGRGAGEGGGGGDHEGSGAGQSAGGDAGKDDGTAHATCAACQRSQRRGGGQDAGGGSQALRGCGGAADRGGGGCGGGNGQGARARMHHQAPRNARKRSPSPTLTLTDAHPH